MKESDQELPEETTTNERSAIYFLQGRQSDLLIPDGVYQKGLAIRHGSPVVKRLAVFLSLPCHYNTRM